MITNKFNRINGDKIAENIEKILKVSMAGICSGYYDYLYFSYVNKEKF